MEDFDERLCWLLLGCLIGFVLGYIVRAIQDTKELTPVDENLPHRNEKGFLKYPFISNIALLVVLCLTVLAAFYSQKASNDVKDAQDRIQRVVYCNQFILSKALNSLNERTTYTSSQSEANVELQKAQAKMLRTLLHRPPYSDDARSKAATDYFQALINFLDLSHRANQKVKENDYPTIEELRQCIDEETKDLP